VPELRFAVAARTVAAAAVLFATGTATAWCSTGGLPVSALEQQEEPMVAKTPMQAAAVERLRAWAVGPEGQKHFRWGTPGDFKRCETFYKGRMPAHMIPGWCSNLHLLATGGRPGHSPAEEAIAAAKKH
jgi:hypothetical protein